MISDATVMGLPQAVEVLRGLEFPSGVLSAYVDTTPGRMQGRAFVMAFFDGVASARHRIERVAATAERADFEVAVEAAGRYLSEETPIASPGLALFVSGRSDYFVAVPLPYRPQEAVSWDAAPRMGPLHAALDEYERVAVLLFDKERARLFTVFLGAIEEEQQFIDDVPGKQATGGWFGLAQSRYARHHEDHVQRHAQHASIALMELLARKPFDRLILAGPDEALDMLREVLPSLLLRRAVGVLRIEVSAAGAEVLEKTLDAAAQAERRYEVLEVAELLDAASSPHVALGVDETLSALGDGRIHVLFIDSNFDGIGGMCLWCGRLVPANAACAWCDGPVAPVSDLRERVIQRAIAQAARVEFVAGPAEDVLVKVGDIGAWTRY